MLHFSEFIFKDFLFIYVGLYACVCMRIRVYADVLIDQKKVLGAADMGVCELLLVGAVMQTLALRFL